MAWITASIARRRPADPRGPIGGLFTSIAQLLATAIGIAQTRLELLSTELQEEIHRVAEIMVLAAVALLAAGVGLFLLALGIIFVFWDTHRVAASIAVTGAFFLIAVVAGARAAGQGAQQAAAARRDAGRAQEGPRQPLEQALRRARERSSQGARGTTRRGLQATVRGATRQHRARELRASKRGSLASIASAGLARSALLHPAVIVGGIVALLTIGRLRGMRLVGRLYLLSTAARRLVQIVRVFQGRVARVEPDKNAQGAAMSMMRWVAVAALGLLARRGAGAAELRAERRRRAMSAASRIPRISCSCRGRRGSSRAAWPRAPGFYLVDSKAGTATRCRSRRSTTPTFASCATPPTPQSLNTHGLNIRASGPGRAKLYVVGHGAREAIEVFDVDATVRRPTLTWRGCVPMPEGLAANSVASFADGSIVATVLFMPGTTFADAIVDRKPTGAVFEWSPGDAGFTLVRRHRNCPRTTASRSRPTAARSTSLRRVCRRSSRSRTATPRGNCGRRGRCRSRPTTCTWAPTAAC